MKLSIIALIGVLTFSIVAETHARGLRGGGFRSSSFRASRSYSPPKVTPKPTPAPVVHRDTTVVQPSSGGSWFFPAAMGYMIGTSGNSHAREQSPSSVVKEVK